VIYFFACLFKLCRAMSVVLLGCLTLLTVVSLAAERAGAPLALALRIKGDIKRETRWLAQYGQATCTVVVAALVWRLDLRRQNWGLSPAVMILVGVLGTGFLSGCAKRLLGRVRPGWPDEGRFLGFQWRHQNSRESFPSLHSATAIALSVLLGRLYPQAWMIFWGLGLVCALLRYLMDAHWPSDVAAGITLGYGLACWAWRFWAVPWAWDVWRHRLSFWYG
jgi:membrane-associated phospholipid phosphatase